MNLVNIASSWHGGQWSALYKFACNNGKIFDTDHQDMLMSEIRECMYPRDHVNYDEDEHKELEALLKYIKEWVK